MSFAAPPGPPYGQSSGMNSRAGFPLAPPNGGGYQPATQFPQYQQPYPQQQQHQGLPQALKVNGVPPPQAPFPSYGPPGSQQLYTTSSAPTTTPQPSPASAFRPYGGPPSSPFPGAPVVSQLPNGMPSLSSAFPAPSQFPEPQQHHSSSSFLTPASTSNFPQSRPMPPQHQNSFPGLPQPGVLLVPPSAHQVSASISGLTTSAAFTTQNGPSAFPPLPSGPPAPVQHQPTPSSFPGPSQPPVPPPQQAYTQRPYPQPSGYTQAATNGYPQRQQQQLANQFGQMNVSGSGYRPQVVDLLHERDIGLFGFDDIQYDLPGGVAAPHVRCSPDVFRCTTMAFPKTEELIKKSRLPVGLTLHPFRDMKNLNVVTTSQIVRCRYCRTYINPYVHMPDNRHWKCNICARSNDLPDDFLWNPTTKAFDDATARPEIQNATIEYIAPSEYMPIRKNRQGNNEMDLLIDRLPGDDRTTIAFIAVDRALHFFQFSSPNRPPREIVMDDVEEPSLPTNQGLLVNLKKYMTAVRAFVQHLPSYFDLATTSENSVGAALLTAQSLIAEIGGRITVFQSTLPTVGPGTLSSREDPNQRAGTDVQNLVSATDFYKRLALECTGQQIGIDLFLMNRQYADLTTLADMAKFSSGSVFHFPGLHINRDHRQVKRFEKILSRYLTRRIGFEAVLRIRCSKGVVMSAFYGNFFVRSTDLLSMANVSPDSALAVTLQLEEPISNPTVCFQAALLYTSSKGDRRIRVHTLCIPTTQEIQAVFNNFDIKAAISLLAKLGVERCLTGGSMPDSREAIVNSAIDALQAWSAANGRSSGMAQLLAPVGHLRLFPRYSLALLKHRAFTAGTSVRLDDRVAAMLMFRFAPLEQILLELYPALYAVHNITELPEKENGEENWPSMLPLSFERIQRDGVFVLDAGSSLYLYVAQAVPSHVIHDLFGVAHFGQIDEDESLKELDTELSRRVHAFVKHISQQRAFLAPLVIIREDGPMREEFAKRLVDDRTESTHSYIEFLQHIRREVHGR